jgi:hypothetical protein
MSAPPSEAHSDVPATEAGQDDEDLRLCSTCHELLSDDAFGNATVKTCDRCRDRKRAAYTAAKKEAKNDELHQELDARLPKVAFAGAIVKGRTCTSCKKQRPSDAWDAPAHKVCNICKRYRDRARLKKRSQKQRAYEQTDQYSVERLQSQSVTTLYARLAQGTDKQCTQCKMVLPSCDFKWNESKSCRVCLGRKDKNRDRAKDRHEAM